jgi:uncharacterized protein
MAAAFLLAPAAAWPTGVPAGPDRVPVANAQPAPSAGVPRAAPADTGYPAPTGFVNDRAGVMDEPARARLEAFLDQVKRKTGVQFAVLTLRTTAPLDPIQYKTEAYQRWFHGNRTSLLLLVALEERKIAFETGYELEGILPDGLEARIIRTEMTPRFRTGDFADGIIAGTLRVSSIIAKDRGVTLEWDGRELRYSPEGRGGGEFPRALLVFVVAMILFGLVPQMLGGGRGRRGSGWWIGPGSFGGFGGGFGGGGSGGGGFGGFGGGGGFGSGGGGGSGGW